MAKVEHQVAKISQIPHSLRATMEWKPGVIDRKNAIITNYLRGAESYLIVGYLLCQARTGEDYLKDGSSADNFWDWCQKEMKIGRTNAQRMMQIWTAVNKYLSKHSDLILQIDFTKLAMVAPLIEKMKEAEALEWLHAAKENTVSDLEQNIKARKGLPTKDNCDHINTDPWVRCVRCNKFFKGGENEKR